MERRDDEIVLVNLIKLDEIISRIGGFMSSIVDVSLLFFAGIVYKMFLKDFARTIV